MEISLQLMLILSVLGVAQALLLSIALLTTKRGNRISNRLLAAFAATIAVSIAGVCLIKIQYSPTLYLIGKSHQPITFLSAPLLFLYVRSLLIPKQTWEKKQLLHFIPAALCLVYLAPFYAYFGPDTREFISTFYGVAWFSVRGALLILQFVIYFAVIIVSVVRHNREHNRLVSEGEKVVRFKIRFLFATFLGLWVIGLAHYIASVSSPAYYKVAEGDLIVPVTATLIVYALGYLGLREPKILADTNDGLAEPAIKKYEKSTLTPERANEYLKRLITVMEVERPYSDGKLTLQTLAKKVSISPHHLSQILNERLNQNFFDFVNGYRIEEAKKKLVEPAKKHYSILGISEEVGFNSKSAFHTAFKKHTNMTPTEFRNASNGK